MNVGRNDKCPCGREKKFKYCHIGKIVPHISKSFTFSIKKGDYVHKIFRINFHHNKRGQSSIIISLPYFEKTKGLLSRITFPANIRRIDKLSMKPGGTTTSCSIKYSHWSDGNSHFSQDGKILTKIKNVSSPLNTSIGHLFTIQIQGLKGFTLKEDEKKRSLEGMDLDVVLSNDVKSVKFIGWWYSSSVVHDTGNHYGNPYLFKRDDGTTETAFALQAPSGSPLTDKILFISISSKPFLTKEKGSHLLFLGGYDPLEVFKDFSKDFHFLSALYPARSYKKLLEEIGSVDLDKNLFQISSS